MGSSPGWPTGCRPRARPWRRRRRGGEARDSGPIGIVGINRLAGQAVANNQWAIFIAIPIQLNIVVGVFNLLPLPPMDGGYLAFVLWQVVTRREVDLRKVVPVAALIVGLLVMLTVGLVWSTSPTRPLPIPIWDAPGGLPARVDRPGGGVSRAALAPDRRRPGPGRRWRLSASSR